jgi:hypothetical protein
MHKLKKSRLTAIVFGLVLSLTLVSAIFCAPTVAKAAPTSVAGCNMINANDFGCNIVRAPDQSGNGASTIYYYGTYGFYNPLTGQFEESFCIEMGVGAPNLADGDVNGEVTYTGNVGLGAGIVNVPDFGAGSETDNARYAVGWLMNQYYAGALDGQASDILYEGTLINQSSGTNENRVKVAVALSYLVHALFDIKNPANTALLAGYFASLPTSYHILLNHLLGIVPNLHSLLPQITTAYVAYENNLRTLIVGLTSSSFYVKEAVAYQNMGSYIKVPNYNGQTITFCNNAQYPIIYSIGHSQQDSTAISNDLTNRELCATARADDNFNFANLESQMLSARYATGNVIDRISYSYSNWPCNASTVASNGSCTNYAVLNATIKLYKRTNLTDNVSSPYTTRTIQLTRQSETSGTVDVNFGSLPPAFYTAQVELNLATGQILHPNNLSVTSSTPESSAVLKETVSTYNCQLNHSSQASSYSILPNQGVWDVLNIGGRCSYGTVNAGNFAAKTTGEVMLVGPLTTVPPKNLTNQQPQFSCAYGAATCVFAVKTVELKNGELRYGSFSEPLRPTDPGLYVFVYHFSGDVFTPEFYSDASDGAEMFYIPPSQNSVQMWSKAEPRALVGSNFTDTAYIAGNVRSGAYVVFDAYRAENPDGIPVCTQKLYDGTSSPQLVTSNGGKYVSPAVSSSELGNVYWVATLYEANGTIYRNTTETGFEEIRGTCGEKEETTEVFWDVELSSNATKDAVIGTPIFDTAHISASTSVPTGLLIEFSCYKDNGYLVGTDLVYYNSKSLTHLGDVSSASFVPSDPGRYYWVVTIYDQFNRIVAQGDYGDPSETSHIFAVTSEVSERYIQSGQEIQDTFYIQGDISPNAVLVPQLWFICETSDSNCSHSPQLVADINFAPIIIENDIRSYKTEPVKLYNVGKYYFTYTIYTDFSQVQALHADNEAYDSETFDVLDLTSSTPATVYIGQEFHDTVTLLGNYPESSCIYWELYYILDQSSVWNDKLVDRSDCQIFDNLSTTVEPLTSHNVRQLIPGKYYWVAYVQNSQTGKLLAQGDIRDQTETTEVLNLNSTVLTESETVTSAYIGERFEDTVLLTGRIPEDGWIIWDIYYQNSSSANPVDDQLVLTTEPKALKEGNYFEEQQLLRIVSDSIAFTEPGKYYWVERIYSPLQLAPVGIGKPRLKNETVEVKPHTGIVTTMSKATDFVRIGQNFYDTIYLTCNLTPSTELVETNSRFTDEQLNPTPNSDISKKCWELLANGTVKWEIFRKNLHSDDVEDDELVHETDTVALSDGKVNQHGELELQSKGVSFQVPGVYYWVESIVSPLQDQLVAKQAPRIVQETTIVEETNSKYVRIGKKNSATELNLATTGITLGKIVGTAAIVSILAIISSQVSNKTKRRNKKWDRTTKRKINAHRIKHTWWGYSYRLH